MGIQAFILFCALHVSSRRNLVVIILVVYGLLLSFLHGAGNDFNSYIELLNSPESPLTQRKEWSFRFLSLLVAGGLSPYFVVQAYIFSAFLALLLSYLVLCKRTSRFFAILTISIVLIFTQAQILNQLRGALVTIIFLAYILITNYYPSKKIFPSIMLLSLPFIHFGSVIVLFFQLVRSFVQPLLRSLLSTLLLFIFSYLSIGVVIQILSLDAFTYSRYIHEAAVLDLNNKNQYWMTSIQVVLYFAVRFFTRCFVDRKESWQLIAYNFSIYFSSIYILLKIMALKLFIISRLANFFEPFLYVLVSLSLFLILRGLKAQPISYLLVSTVFLLLSVLFQSFLLDDSAVWINFCTLTSPCLIELP